MAGPISNPNEHEARNRAMFAEVARIVSGFFMDARTQLSRLDRWAERRILDENLAKAGLVVEAEDAVEHAYQNLIREIDTEARNGIFLASPAAEAAQLRTLSGESGISGRLHEHVETLAPLLFPDETEHSNAELDLVWASLSARYDRASAEARVSQSIIARLLDDDDAAEDMSDALRALFYAYHEHTARQHAGLPLLLSDREAADLRTMVAELATRSGSYGERVRLISSRSGG